MAASAVRVGPWPGSEVRQDPHACTFCQDRHQGPCPRISAMEYWPDGSCKRIEFRDGPVDEESLL